jgi:tight adherence protein B
MAIALLAAAWTGGVAHADPSGGVRGVISGVKTADGLVQFVFSAVGLPAGSTLDLNSVVVQAGDRKLAATASLGATGTGVVNVVKPPERDTVVALDTSGSMQGDGIAGARAAALEYAASMPPDVRVGLVTFSDRPHLLLTPTTNRLAFESAVRTVHAGGNTTLYDGLITAVRALGAQRANAVHRLLVLSDGADTSSTRSLSDAISAATGAGVPIDVVAFRLPGDQAVLRQIASASHGTVLAAQNAKDLATAFTVAAAKFQSQVLVTVQVPTDLAGQRQHLVVTMNTQDETITASLTMTLPSATTAATTGIGPKISAAPATASKLGLWVLVGMVFVALLIVALMSLWTPAVNAERGRINARIAEVGRYRVVANLGREQFAAPVTAPAAENSLARAVLGWVDRLVRAGGKRQTIVEQLERAGLRMRPEEWLILQVTAVIVAAAVITVLSGNPFGVVVGGLLGYLATRAYMNFKTARRQRAFSDQLPDVLQLVAGSLRSGFSLNQAVAGVVRDGSEPTASEFARAMTEVRLGSDLEDALDRVAERMECADLHWVVLAVRISREVGGNLAEVLMNTVGTMRERAQIRGQIRVLSAEGRISARILIALPFLLGGYLGLTNPSYLKPLFTTATGLTLMVVGVVLLVLGAFWISRLVKIEV